MPGLNSNDLSKTWQRFMDIKDEPLTTMTPIRGYEKMPLVSLEQAVQPLIQNIPEIEHMVDIAKKRCKNPPSDQLTIDQSAAIILYTLEWTPKEESVYYRLNKALRTEDRQVLKPWFSYLKLLFTALSLLPSDTRVVFRGVREDLKSGYRTGEKVVWWGFSSCTSKQDVLNNESFMGSSGKRTLFTIESQSGKEIKQHSYFKDENEVLLPAAREFQVESVFPQADGLCLIQLKEVQPKHPLLEPSTTFRKNISKTPSSQFNPIYKQPIQTPQYQPYHTETHQSTEQNSTTPISYNNQSRGHRKRWLLGVTCGLIFCCPCTICYLLIK